jgi:hypothetical protein
VTRFQTIVSKLKRLRAYPEHLRFKYAPRLARLIVSHASSSAIMRLSGEPPLTILVDNTVLYHAVTHETAWISTGPSSWGDRQIDTGYAARVAVHPADSKSREYGNVLYLAGIAELSRRKIIRLHTSAELQEEQFRQPSGRYRGYSYFDHSLFSGLDIPSIDGQVFGVMGPKMLGLPSVQDQQRARLRAHEQDPLFAKLVRCLGPANSQDAWHIYTAERHGMFCFLTMDFKLIRTVRSQIKADPLRSFRTLVLTPEELGARVGLRRVPPHLFSYDDASFFVRSDVAMPDGKRRPLKKYKRDDR